MNRIAMFLPLATICLLFINTLCAKDFKAELVLQKTNIKVKNNQLTRQQYFEIRINKRTGEDYTSVEIPFSNLVKVSNLSAFIKDKNGKVIKKLKKGDITERSSYSSISFYEDEFVKEFTLKHNQYPYFLCYEYEEKENEFLYIDYWLPVLDLDIPTLKAELTIECDQNYKFSTHSQHISEFKKDSVTNTYLYSWQVNYDGSLKHELFSPPLISCFPLVAVIPQTYKFEQKGSFKSWETYGTWQHNLIKDMFELPASKKEKVKQLTQGIVDTKEIVTKIYKYVQDETRYINISLKTGGLKPYPASYVCQNQYGDCKALSIYLMALLKSIGIDCYYAKINAGNPIEKVIHSLPSMQSNHIIVCVPLKNDTLWLDCTSDNPIQYIGTFIQNRDVLIIDQDKSFFTTTPSLEKEQVLCERKVILQNSSAKGCEAEFKNLFRGELFESLNYLKDYTNNNERIEVLRDNFIEKSFEPSKIKQFDVLVDSAKAFLQYTATSNKVYAKYNNELIIKLLPFKIGSLEKPSERIQAVQIDYPIFKKDYLTYKIPGNQNISHQPEDYLIQSEFGEYKIHFELSGKNIEVEKTFYLKKGEYPNSAYTDFYDFIKSIEKFEKRTVITTTKKI